MQLRWIWNSIFRLGVTNLKNHKNNITKYKIQTSKMLNIPHFYSLLIKTSTMVGTKNLETFQVFGKMIWLFEFLVSGSICEDLILLHLLSWNIKWLNVKTLNIMKLV